MHINYVRALFSTGTYRLLLILFQGRPRGQLHQSPAAGHEGSCICRLLLCRLGIARHPLRYGTAINEYNKAKTLAAAHVHKLPLIMMFTSI